MRRLNNEKEIRAAAARLRYEIEKSSYRHWEVTWGFPNGHRHSRDTCVLRGPKHDIYIGFGALEEDTIAHAIKLVEHGSDPTDAFHPNVEVNISAIGRRGTAGVLAADENNVWLCHSAMFNVFRTRIAREKSLTFFRDFVVPILDDDATREIIPVVVLDSPTFVADLEAFVLRVLDLKEHFKAGDVISSPSEAESANSRSHVDVDPWRWNDGDEFEGTKTIATRNSVTYEYLHGPVCNRLKNALLDWVSGKELADKLTIRRTVNIDAAIVGANNRARVIFEVKTSSSLGDQLYKAIGQLFHYRHKRGDVDVSSPVK